MLCFVVLIIMSTLQLIHIKNKLLFSMQIYVTEIKDKLRVMILFCFRFDSPTPDHLCPV